MYGANPARSTLATLSLMKTIDISCSSGYPLCVVVIPHTIFPPPATGCNVQTPAAANCSSTNGEKMEIEVGEKNPIAVIVPPGVVHGYKCISEIDALSLNFPDKLYRGEGKGEEVDEIRWEKDPNSPYKIS